MATSREGSSIKDTAEDAQIRNFEKQIQHYAQRCRPRRGRNGNVTGPEVITAPVFSSEVAPILLRNKFTLGQFAHLGHLEERKIAHSEAGGVNATHGPDMVLDSDDVTSEVPNSGNMNGLNYVLLNSNAPWSAFVCGSQGSGKSYTTACLIEGLLIKDKQIGTLESPAAAMVFHYERMANTKVNPCEIASLCSAGVKIEILVSPSNFDAMNSAYKAKYPKHFEAKSLVVKKLFLRSADLNSQRIQTFMAAKSSGEKPLYMNMLERLLRDMARDQEEKALCNSTSTKRFDYQAFRNKLEMEIFNDHQRDSLDQRLSCLESFFAGKKQGFTRTPIAKGSSTHTVQVRTIDDKIEDMLMGKPGHLTLVDLTDPTFDATVACGLFNLCLAAFVERTEGPKVIALDEAHNYIGQGSSGDAFTEDLLKIIREQRHNGSRVIIATQEPTLSTKFLDLCSMTIVHRFTSPDWFRTLRGHLGGASFEADMADEELRHLFRTIGELEPGESMFFCPTALLDVEDGVAKPLEFRFKIMQTRERLSEDAGTSVMAQQTGKAGGSVELSTGA